jgi:hypothetical protein
VTESQTEHVASLAQELLDDIELSRVPAESLILKAARLARFAGTEDVRTWLSLELSGYNDFTPVAKSYMERTGRWIDREKRTAYWGGFAEQVASIESLQAEQQTVRVPDVAGDLALLTVRDVMGQSNWLGGQIRALQRVKSRVLALLHQWVSGVHYEALFGGAAEDVFEQFRAAVDGKLADVCASVLERLPAVYDRLRSSDPEAVSQAMTTCRRIIEAFADSVFPPTTETLEVDGSTLNLGPQHHQNRINAFVIAHTESRTRRKRLRQTLANLHDRVCAAIHEDVSSEEARALVLQTYVFLGELVEMESPPASQDAAEVSTA